MNRITRQSAWYYTEIRSCAPPLTTSSIEERWRRVRRGGSAILQRVVRRATRYSYPPPALVNIALFTSSSRAATPAAHAITRLACPQEVKSRPHGKFARAREYDISHCSPSHVLSFSVSAILSAHSCIFPRRKRITIRTTSYFAEECRRMVYINKNLTIK